MSEHQNQSGKKEAIQPLSLYSPWKRRIITVLKQADISTGRKAPNTINSMIRDLSSKYFYSHTFVFQKKAL